MAYRAGAFILVVAIGTPSLFVTIPGQALTELLRNPGAVFAPFLGRLKTSNDVPPAAPSTSAEWFEDRSGLPAIAASEPPLIPDDAIVLLVTIDALRHELLEEEKYRKKLPNLFRLRDESVYFTEARAPSSATSPSLSAIFTGRFYSGLYWTKWKKGRGRGKYFLGDEKRDRFTHILSARSIDTVVFLTTDGLRNSYGICGGFSEEPRASKKRQVPARAVFDAMIKNLENDSAGAKFFYTHLMEPHAPYNLAGKKGSPFKRYLGEVALAGRELGRFIGRLKQMGLYDRVVLIVGADHGEAFGEHNTHKHASTLYEELLRVPLFIRVPSVESRRVTEPVSLADLGPTILDLFGSATPASFLGQSLTPFLRGKDPKLERPLVAESGRHVRVMYFRDRYKLIEDRRRGLIELYNLELDPGELNNRYDPEDPESRERLATLQKFFTTHELKREGYKLPYRK